LDDGRVVPNFIKQALTGQSLTVYGDGSQTRSFCYVSDLVAGIYKMMYAKIAEPVNLGNPKELKIIDFANNIIKLTGSRSRLFINLFQKTIPNRGDRTSQSEEGIGMGACHRPG